MMCHKKGIHKRCSLSMLRAWGWYELSDSGPSDRFSLLFSLVEEKKSKVVEGTYVGTIYYTVKRKGKLKEERKSVWDSLASYPKVVVQYYPALAVSSLDLAALLRLLRLLLYGSNINQFANQESYGPRGRARWGTFSQSCWRRHPAAAVEEI